MLDTQQLCRLGLAVIETEAHAILQLNQRIDSYFAKACEIMLACEGRIVVLGIGKSGHIASKIAATLASTGTPAFFVHPGDASHGDMGMITKKDVVLALSKSGQSREILTLIPLIKRLQIPFITLTGNPESPLAQSATINLDVSVPQEACPLGLAPTASTTATLVMGDALAIALLQARGFTADDFAFSHPGGQLGRRLLLHLEDIMHSDNALPKVDQQTTLCDALFEVTEKKLGMTCVVREDGTLCGIFTDGDLRRCLNRDIDIHNTPIAQVMTSNCKTVSRDMLAIDALNLMENYKITALIVTDPFQKPIGVIHMHDLLRAGVV